ncbi:glucoamylase [Desulfocucumis palustris]|uniref:Glucoamylase n=1 Tax=Desulfocucumis palustris TaxID=1898651 RepID=A0A2L2XCU6_9FIRM|nr:glycoside hydrolase family 15 protein [Desulfocucumis palustris]GBF34068.1 glucoamylase [Desulfocucumis palustris]
MDNRYPVMPGGIAGNSNMLAVIKSNGELNRLFWPNIDWGQHMGVLKVGLQEPPQPTLWLDSAGWEYSQQYVDGTNILVTAMSNHENGIKIELTDLVLPHRDILLRSYKIKNLFNHRRDFKFIVYCSFTINESEIQDGMYVEPDKGFLIQFRRNVYLGLTLEGKKPFGFHCGRKNAPSDPFETASRGEFWGGMDNIKSSSGALGWNIDTLNPESEERVTLYLAAAHDDYSLNSTLSGIAAGDYSSHYDETKSYWNGWLASSPRVAGPETQPFALYNRSLLAIKLMSDKENGGSLAAPEFDSNYTASGGYGYCWPRDGMFVAAALDEAGFHHEAGQFYRFASRVQNPDGSWNQRYFLNGDWAPTWGRQIDQAGAVLWGYHHHYLLTGDRGFLDQIWTSLVAGADYLAANLSPDNGLPIPGMDLWEDEFSQNAYAAAAVWGGLNKAAALAGVKNEAELAGKWDAAAKKVKQGILKHQWSEELGTFTRAINRKVCLEEYQYAREQGLQASEIKMPGIPNICYMVPRDNRIDSALLGLCYPFGVLPPGDPRMSATVEKITEHLGNHQAGGLHRYQWDGYAGGNPWVLCTLWLSIYMSLKGERKKAEELIRWAERNSSQTGLLPEQADKNTGGPAWVLPLNWSHAMYVLACLAYKGKLKGIN